MSKDNWLSEYEDAIDHAAHYIIERRAIPLTIRSHDDPLLYIKDEHFLEPARIEKTLDRARRHLIAFDREASKIMADEAFGRIDPYLTVAERIRQAHKKALEAVSLLADAASYFDCVRPAPKTCALTEHQSAVRSAISICGETEPRKVRAVAKAIMCKADLLPDKSGMKTLDRNITNWVRMERRMEKERVKIQRSWEKAFAQTSTGEKENSPQQ